jgi:carbamate kinase
MMILTAVPRVAIHFGTPQKRDLDEVTLTDIKRYHAEGHFPAGSMGPKVEAAIANAPWRARQAAAMRSFERCSSLRTSRLSA